MSNGLPDNKDPLAPLVRLGHQLDQRTAKVGLAMVTFAVIIAKDGSHRARVIFVLADEKPVDDDSAFESLIRNQERFELELKAKKAREELERFRAKLEEDEKGGFLD